MALTPRQQAGLRYGVRAILEHTVRHGEIATHELLDIGTRSTSECKVVLVGTEEQCKIVCAALEQAYVAGAEANAHRVTLNGKFYTLTEDK